MTNRRIQGVLLVLAAALLLWGMSRGVRRGDASVKSWPAYLMVALLLTAAGNVVPGYRGLAIAVIVGCGFLALCVLVAATRPSADPNRTIAVVRALCYFVLVGAMGVLQTKSRRSQQQDGA